MEERFRRNGIEITRKPVTDWWTHGVMAVTGGHVWFEVRICDNSHPNDSWFINGGRILKLGWDWGPLASIGHRIPLFDGGWDMKGPFIPLNAYGEQLDCLNKLLVAVGDRPFAERFVDLNENVPRAREPPPEVAKLEHDPYASDLEVVASKRLASTKRLVEHGIEITRELWQWWDKRRIFGKMAVTGGHVEFKAIIFDDPNRDGDWDRAIRSGRIEEVHWNWSALAVSNRRTLPDFSEGWRDPSAREIITFLPLDAYGEQLDCLNKLLVAVGDQPFAERLVDINDTALQGGAAGGCQPTAVKRAKRSLEATQQGAGTDAK